MEGSDGLLIEVDGQIVPNYDATMVAFDEGDVVSGAVVRIDQDEVLVDIGYKSEGVIPSNELSIRKSVDPADEVELGEEVDALVLTKEDQDGRLLLSKKRARFEKAWRRIEAAAESGEPVEGTVIEVVKGGLIIDLGVRGFLPASLVDIRRVQNLDEFMSTKIECKVIELNRSRNNVVLSRRAVLEEERKEVRQQILDRLQPGQVVEGDISNIVDFGAFVDLDGIDGLIHISELSWSHVNHPSEILSIGDTVPVKVLDIDRDRQRISLGLKQTQEDPWQRVLDTYNLGDELEGKVTKVVTFGAFVEIMDGVEGLVHISELAHHHVENPREVVEPGRRGEGQGARDRLRAPPPLAERQARRPARRRAAGRPPRRARAADLDDVRDLDLSDDLFAGARDRGGDRAVARRRGARGPRPRRGPPPRRPAAEEPAEPGGPASRRASRGSREPRTSAEDESRSEPAVAGSVHRPDRRDGRRQVRGARRPRASWAPPRCRPTRWCTSCCGTDEVRDALVERFGDEIAPDGVVDRATVGERVFADPAERAWLEELLWPRVGERVAEWREESAPDPPPAPPSSRCPLLFEAGMEAAFDHTSRWWPTRYAASSAPARAATPASRSATTASSPRTRRRNVRTSWCATTARVRS